MSIRAAVAAGAAVSMGLVACGSQQFAPRNESETTAPSASSTTAAASTTSAASTGVARARAVPSTTTSATAPPRKYVIARHVLIQWMGCKAADTKIVRTKEQARAVAEDVLRRLKAGEEFTRVVLDYSDEPNAGRRGGSLPPFGRGTMDKQFETVAFGLGAGELSGIVETPFGFHVIQRLE